MNRIWPVSSEHASIALIVAAILFATEFMAEQLVPTLSHAVAAEPSREPTRDPAGADSITVSVASGRHFTGQLDPQTDLDLLWLRVGEGSIVVRRPIEWERIVRVRQGEKELSAEELRFLARASSAEASGRQLPAPPIPAEDGTVEKPWAAAPATPVGSERAINRRAADQVRSLQIDVELGHWTASVEPSGIVVCIHPTTADGALTPIDGTLAVDLLGQRPASQGQGDGLATIGRWTETVRMADFGPLGAEYRLPFQAVHPDFDLELRAHGLVHARLIVPGQGTFETSSAMVRLRPYSSVRDRLQQNTGSRFAPIEQTER
jgi:hypothetical protein